MEVLFPPFFNRVYFISAIKEGVIKESARIKQVLKMNEYQGNISKIFNRITDIHSLSQS